jgi:hypothetical protein
VTFTFTLTLWSKMIRGFPEQYIQTVNIYPPFIGTPKYCLYYLDIRDRRWCIKSQLHVFTQLSLTYKKRLIRARY